MTSSTAYLRSEAFDVLHCFLEAAGPVLGASAKLGLVRDVDALLREGHTPDELTVLVQRYALARRRDSLRAFLKNGDDESTGRVVRAWWTE